MSKCTCDPRNDMCYCTNEFEYVEYKEQVSLAIEDEYA